jgi:hypothetical protein
VLSPGDIGWLLAFVFNVAVCPVRAQAALDFAFAAVSAQTYYAYE